MKVIILAAGQGTRLKKYTANLPKGMLEIEGKTLIKRQIEIYRECGINDIIIVRGYALDKIKYANVKYYDNIDYANTNMVESLMTARSEFTDDILVSYSDILFEKKMVLKMIDKKEDFVVAVDDNWKEYWLRRYGKIDFDTESLSIDENDNIKELGLESPKIESIDARYIGLLKFSKNGLVKIKEIFEKAYKDFNDRPWQQSGMTVRKAYMTDLLNALIESGEKVKVVHFKNGWIEFDTNEDYEKVIEWIKDDSLKSLINI